MKELSISAKERKSSGKGNAGRSRRENEIPAVIYGSGNEAQSVLIDEKSFEMALQKVKKDHLPTTVFNIEGIGKRAIVREVQRHRTRGDILHLDFLLYDENVKMKVKVPVVQKNVESCPGVVLGGIVKTIKRHVLCECLGKDMPVSFPLDMSTVNLKETKRVRDLEVGEGIRVLELLKDAVVTVAKR